MKIAIAQLNPIIGDLSGNAQKILAAAHSVPAMWDMCADCGPGLSLI